MRLRRGHKYRARRTEYGGQTYDSGAEARYAQQLDLLKRAGEIVGWERGKPVVLIDGPNRRERVTYRPDFLVHETWDRTVAVDVKGVRTQVFRLKALLWRERNPDTPLVVVDTQGRETARYEGGVVVRAQNRPKGHFRSNAGHPGGRVGCK